MHLGSGLHAKRSSRDVDVLFDRWAADLQRAVKAETSSHATRVQKHEDARRAAHEAAAAAAVAAAERRQRGSDSVKVAEAEGYEGPVCDPSTAVAPAGSGGGRRGYRALASHNALIGHVHVLCLQRHGSSFGLRVSATPFLMGLSGHAMAAEVLVATVVRAAFFTMLSVHAASPPAVCHLLHDGSAAERNTVLATLRELRQSEEAEGHDWFPYAGAVAEADQAVAAAGEAEAAVATPTPEVKKGKVRVW